MHIPTESCAISGVVRSLLEFVSQIFWTEPVNDLINQNGPIKCDKLFNT